MSVATGVRTTRGQAWESYFTTTARLRAHMETELKATCSLSLPEYNVLMQVARSGAEGIRPGALADDVVFSPSRLTHTLRRLRMRGLLERHAFEADARGGLITLTVSGRSLYARAADVHRALVRRLALEGMTPEEAEILDRVFSRIADRIARD